MMYLPISRLLCYKRKKKIENLFDILGEAINHVCLSCNFMENQMTPLKISNVSVYIIKNNEKKFRIL